MRIRDGIGAEIIRPLAAAGPLRHADEETPIGSQAVDGLEVLAFFGIFPGDLGEQGTA